MIVPSRRLSTLVAVVALATVALLSSCASVPESINGAYSDAQAKTLSVPAQASSYVPGQLVVGIAGPRSETAREEIAAQGFDASTTLYESRDEDAALVLVKTGDGHRTGDDLQNAANGIAAIAGVNLVQPNYRYASSAENAADLAEDPYADRQWYLDSWDDSHGASVAATWAMANSGNRVDVAVLDTGMYSMADYDSGSLAADNPVNFHQEFDADNLDMAAARDFVNSGEGEPLPLVNEQNPTGDDNGHGTHVAGIIAANSSIAGKTPLGIAGVSNNARIIPCKVLNGGGEGDTASFIRAYQYLLDGDFPNLRVINLSVSLTFDDGDEATEADEGDTSEVEIEPGDEEPVEWVDDGEEDEDEALHQLIAQAKERGIITVCAAGNDGSSDSTYPGDFDECLCVMALDPEGSVAAYSNANDAKDIAAPGTGVYSTWASQADAYMTLDGTSQATAIVSGVLATLFAAKPDLQADDALDALYRTAWPVDGAGNGAIDAFSAMQLVTTGSFDKEEKESSGSSSSSSASAPASAFEKQISIAKATVKTAKSTYAYTGKARTPKVTVTLNGKTLKRNVDYTVTYSGNVKPGTGKVTVTGKGSYTGKIAKTFKIKLNRATIKKPVGSKKAFTAKWKQQKLGKVGYQIRYSLNKNMKKAKKKSVKKNATVKLKVGKLKSGKKYYVQVRTFKKIGGKTYFSKWSAKKSVKVK